MSHPHSSHDALHICIATGQNAANLIPLKQLQARRVLILETPGMQKSGSAKNLRHALKQALPEDASIEILPFDDSTPIQIVSSAQALVMERLVDQHVLFHITGGTKLMVLALQDQLKLLEASQGSLLLVYADTSRRTLDWYAPDRPEKPWQEPMQDLLTLQDQLLVQGYRNESDTRAEKARERVEIRKEMTKTLAHKGTLLAKELSVLATLGNQATKYSLLQKLEYSPRSNFAEVLAEANNRGLLIWSEDAPHSIEFFNIEDARYFAGLWLEDYVFLQMHSGIFQQGRYAVGVQIRRISKSGTPYNELDAVAVHNNRMLLVECKTGRQGDATRDALYKLGQLSNEIAGSAGKALYISAQTVSDADRERARDYNIEIIDGENIRKIGEYLRSWRDTGEFPTKTGKP